MVTKMMIVSTLMVTTTKMKTIHTAAAAELGMHFPIKKLLGLKLLNCAKNIILL